ncbi:MAG: hypothetical protein COA69_10895 [Robiginitomaculum sp.]|nr:MAG: hypothetical protein COA69_10895 [Robiginitomaculum sp.]
MAQTMAQTMATKFLMRPLIGIMATALFSLSAGAQEALSKADTEKPVTLCEACIDVMTATQIANAFWDELAVQPDYDNQVEIVSKYLNLITFDLKNMPESRLERLALGEGAYLTFQVQEANAYFSSLLEGNDLISAHAWERMLQITNRALGENEKALEMLNQHYGKFALTDKIYRGRYQQVSNFAYQYVQDKEPEKAVALIEKELRALPENAPYSSYALLPSYKKFIDASSRKDALHMFVQKRLSKLQKLNRKWEKEKDIAGHDPILNGEMPDWYWRTQSVKKDESLRAARKRQLTKLIGNLETWLGN